MEKKIKYAVDIKKLNKSFINKKKKENVLALIDVNIKIPKGSLFGLLGLNGAGKSTIINILAGLCLKNSGTVKINNYDIDTNRKQASCQIGIVPQELNFDPFFTPSEILEVQAGLYGIKKKNRKTKKILQDLDLYSKANSYTRSLSGGMKRRLLIAKALVHQPPIIILDEPTAGVDVELRKNLWENVKSLNKQGVTIILTTHNLSEAEEMCQRIGILNKGILVALDSTKNLLDKIKTKKITFKLNRNINLNSNMPSSLNVILNKDNEIVISYEKNKITTEEIINLIQKQNAKIIDITTDDGDLEDVFIKLTKD